MTLIVMIINNDDMGRCVDDDGYGVGEALQEDAYGVGLVARGQHFLYTGTTAGARLLQQEKVLTMIMTVIMMIMMMSRSSLPSCSSWPPTSALTSGQRPD